MLLGGSIINIITEVKCVERCTVSPDLTRLVSYAQMALKKAYFSG